MKRCLLLALLFTCTSAAIAADKIDQQITVSSSLAWDGYIRPGQPTEISLDIFSSSGGPETIQVTSGTIRQTIVTELTAGTSRLLSIPYRPLINQPVVVSQITADGEHTLAETQASRVVTDRLVVATTADTTMLSAPDKDFSVLRTSARALPRTIAAYLTANLIIIDENTLAELDDRQSAALAGYLRQCGKVIAVALTTVSASRITNDAGCQRASLLLLDDSRHLGSVVNRLLDYTAPELPTETELLTLIADNDNNAVLSVTLFFVFYFLLLAIAGISRTQTRFLLAIPLIASGIALSAWWHRDPQISRIQWYQTDSGASTARYRSLFVITGNGIGDHTLTLPANDTIHSDDDIRLTRRFTDEGHAAPMELNYRSYLLSRTVLTMDGHTDISPPLRLEDFPDRPKVINSGDTASTPAILAWDQRYYQVPALNTGASWHPTDSDEIIDDFPGKAILQNNSADAALLVHFRDNHNGVSSTPPDASWLLIRHPSREITL